MKLHKLLVFAAFIIPALGNAEDLSLQTKITSKKSQLGLAYEMSSFTADEGTIVGSGGRLHFFHSFNNTYSGQVYLSAALNQEGAVQNSFTGLGGTVFYNLYGDTVSQQREISLSGNLVASEQTSQTQCLLVGAGISQYFFNGNEGVYSASGFNVTLSYQLTLYKIRWEALARYNILGAGSTSLTGTNLSLGINIPL
ncbi:MAG: hypothetical protein IT287_02035 [Bdellovibrionaceae bacterium]|nr:hypothetical protein [Pseudobdellovibrionaceae bacterium]